MKKREEEMRKKQVKEKLSDEEELKRYHQQKAKESHQQIKNLSKEKQKNWIIKKRGPRKKWKQQSQQQQIDSTPLKTTLMPPFSVEIPTIFENYTFKFPRTIIVFDGQFLYHDVAKEDFHEYQFSMIFFKK